MKKITILLILLFTLVGQAISQTVLPPLDPLEQHCPFGIYVRAGNSYNANLNDNLLGAFEFTTIETLKLSFKVTNLTTKI